MRDLSTVTKVVEFLEDVLDTDHGFDYAMSYGEPGYTLDAGLTPMVVLGYYWCRCEEIEGGLHAIEEHYPEEFEALEAQGVELEWYDEWAVVWDEAAGGAAYRVESDSYHWQPSAVLTEDGEWMTPKNSDEEWVEWAMNEPTRCIPSTMLDAHDPTLVGWDDSADDPQVWHEWSEDHYDHGLPTTYSNGWHAGMDATPEGVTEKIHAVYPDADVVFVLTETSQFYTRFEAYYRLPA